MNNRTKEAVWNQIRAMNCPKLNILLLNQKTRQPMNWRGVTPAGVMRLVPYMRFMNMKGWNIYVEPDPKESGALVLVDDLLPQTVEEMRQDGLEPACVVETSPGNVQAWIRFGPGKMPPEERKVLARELARGYGGDPHSAAASHKGRLAGFANLKPRHLGKVREGLPPWVLCRESRGVSCWLWRELRACAKREAERLARRPVRQPAPGASPSPESRNCPESLCSPVPPCCSGLPSPRETAAKAKQYFAEWDRWHKARGRIVNYSERDYGVACRLYRERHPRGQIRQALAALVGREIADGLRKKYWDYVDRTLSAAERRVFG